MIKVRKKAAEKPLKKKGGKRKQLRPVIIWISLIFILIVLILYRYTYQSFLPHPGIVISDQDQEYMTVSREGAFIIEFTQRMNKETVDEAISIIPSMTYKTYWESRTLFIKPNVPLKINEIFRLSVDSSARSLFGRNLKKSYGFTFKVIGDPKVFKIFPEEETVMSEEKVIIIFTHQMVKEEKVGEKFTPNFIEMSPLVDGEWVWHNPKTLLFRPSDGLPLSTRFHLISNENLKTLDSTPIKEKIDRSFETERLKILSADEEEPVEKLSVYKPFSIQFNQPVSSKELKNNVVLQDSRGVKINDIGFKKHSKQANTYLIERSEEPWLYNEEYSLLISESLMPIEGNLSLGKDIAFKFITESLLSINNQKPERKDGYLIIVGEEDINLSFKEEFSREDITKSIHLIPELEFNIEKKDTYIYQLIISDNSQKRENLRVFLKEDINDEDRKFISEPIELIINKPSALNLEIKEEAYSFCVYSNNPLAEESYLTGRDSKDEKKIYFLELANDESCSSLEDYEYSYLFEKKYFEPDKNNNLIIQAIDIYGQSISHEFTVKTRSIKWDEYVLRRRNQSLHKYVNKDDLLFLSYETKNISLLSIKVCKIRAEDAIEIETTYEERWLTFTPGTNICTRYKSFQENIEPDWGNLESHQLNINEIFDEVTPGIYYIHFSSPFILSKEGKEIEGNAVLQYSHLNVFSKRGESSLVWLSDDVNNNPIVDASIYFFSNDGSLLKTEKTDEKGILFIPNNKLKYEYILAKHKDEEIVLSVFEQEGFETMRYNIPFNADEDIYLYKFYIEDLKKNQNQVNGIFILKEKKNGKVVPPSIKTAVVTLYNEHENLLWREYDEFDDFGNLSFYINPKYPLLDQEYQLSICVGLHEGVCHGTEFWTKFSKNAQIKTIVADLAKKDQNSSLEEEERIISLDKTEGYVLGDEVSVNLGNIQSSAPILFTVERDQIYIYEVLNGDKSDSEITFTISEEMIPEVILTITQFQGGDVIYDMKRIEVDNTQKKILPPSFRDNDDVNNLVLKNEKGELIEDYSLIHFELNSEEEHNYEELLLSFYPSLGTSIITAASSMPKSKDENIQFIASPYHSVIQDLTYIDGVISLPGQEENVSLKILSEYEGATYTIVHDKEGNFGSFVLRKEELTKDISLTIGSPSFMRAGDKLIIDLNVINNLDANKNFSLVDRSENINILSGDIIYFGLQAGQSKSISLATETNILNLAPESKLNFLLEDKEKNIFEVSEMLPIVRLNLPEENIKSLVYQDRSNEGNIMIPNRKSGLWGQKIFIASSPISFTLENLKTFLSIDPIQFDEAVFKIALAADYSSLVEEGIEDDEQLNELLKNKESLEKELLFLRMIQKNDGGWSANPESYKSDPVLTSKIAKAVSVLEQLNIEIPEEIIKDCISYLKEQLDQRVNKRLREQTDLFSLEADYIYEEMQILNALSSLNPSGIGYANNWYLHRNDLANESLILLLLSLEDYRDAYVSGMNYKIEEVIQLLKGRRTKFQDKIWLEKSSSNNSVKKSFLLTSWYLEALVRQSSARSDIPAVINWLIENKFKRKNQGPYQQFSFLHSMGAYLKIFQEKIEAAEIQLELSSENMKTFQLKPEKKLQSFSINNFLLINDDQETPPIIRYKADREQTLFIEIIWNKIDKKYTSNSNGLSIYQNLQLGDKPAQGEKIQGEISIISTEYYEEVVVIHPLVAATSLNVLGVNRSNMKTKSFGKQEVWYILDNLPPGETVISFELDLVHSGIFKTPPLYIYVYNHPETFAVSNSELLEIKQ